MRARHFLMALVLTLGASGASPRSSDKVAELTRTATAEIRALDPHAAELFEQANAAREAGDHDGASRLYGEVVAALPSCDHALRRRAFEEQVLGHHEEALALARKAVDVRRNATNLGALATILAFSRREGAAGASDRYEARTLALEASRLDPADTKPLLALAQVAIVRRDFGDARAQLDAALALEPDNVSALHASAIVHGATGDLRAARKALEAAHAHGLPDADYRALSDPIDKATPAWVRAGRIVAAIAAAWVAGFVLLLLVGMALSAAAMRIASRRAHPTEIHAMPPAIRRAYTTLLWASCAFYYVSLPFVLVLVVGFGGGALLLFSRMGFVPVKIALILALMVLVTAWAILRSLFVRVRDEDPGERLDPSAHPRLHGLLEEVAAKIGTRPVDDVFLTPGTSVAVFERGGLLGQARGNPRRCLILGAGALDGLRMPAFRAVLAHEYGHFTNRDCAGGGLALAVRRHLGLMAQGLAQNGAATWYNPAWWFVNAYFRVFLRISHGASRLQEVMADRWAVSAYGSAAFIEGLTHVIRRTLHLSGQARAALQLASMTRTPVGNIYSFAGNGVPSADDVEKALRERLAEPASPYDSHPRAADRFELAAAMDVSTPDQGDGALDAWSLFDDREAIEARMSRAIMGAVASASGA